MRLRDFEVTQHPAFGLQSICGCTGIMLRLSANICGNAAQQPETRKFPSALKAHRGPHPAISGPETVSGLFFLFLIADISGRLLQSSLHFPVFASSVNDWFAKGDAGFRKVSQAQVHRWTRRDQDLTALGFFF